MQPEYDAARGDQREHETLPHRRSIQVGDHEQDRLASRRQLHVLAAAGDETAATELLHPVRLSVERSVAVEPAIVGHRTPAKKKQQTEQDRALEVASDAEPRE